MQQEDPRANFLLAYMPITVQLQYQGAELLPYSSGLLETSGSTDTLLIPQLEVLFLVSVT